MTEFSVAIATHTGLVRARNEDCVGHTGSGVLQGGNLTLATVCGAPLLAVVSDGVGGHPCGDLASRAVVGTLLEHTPTDEAGVLAAVDATATRLRAVALDRPECGGLAATVAAVIVEEDRFIVANIGDSRVYAIEDGLPLTQLTVDHVPASRAIPVFGRSALTRVLGGSVVGQSVQPHLFTERLEPGTRLLLCTDGLTSYVPDSDIAAVLRSQRGAEAGTSLIELALAAGGHDNITVALIET